MTEISNSLINEIAKSENISEIKLKIENYCDESFYVQISALKEESNYLVDKEVQKMKFLKQSLLKIFGLHFIITKMKKPK